LRFAILNLWNEKVFMNIYQKKFNSISNTVKIMILYRLRYRPVTVPLPPRNRQVTPFRDRPSATVTDRYHTVTDRY
jgi:hypothetical protein